MVRNECFRVALDYLYKNGYVVDQRELSQKVGISETSISRILNNRVKEPSDATIRKLNEAFGGIFNPRYFRGESIHLLLEDEAYYTQHPEEDISSSEYIPLSQRQQVPEKSIIELAASLIKEVEGLRQELTAEREALKEERAQLQQIILQLKAFKYPNPYLPTSPQYLASAEPK